jgi:cytochrome c oxidase subunit 2
VNLAPSQSALDPAGVQSTRILGLFWGYFGVSALVFVLVLGALGVALARRAEPTDDGLRRKRRAVGTATALTAITLLVLLVSSAVTGHALASLGSKDAIPIQVIGHRWWWEVVYPDAALPANTFHTANEIHVPVGKPIELQLESRDVIHSFWVPSLHGKRDLIPGKKTTFLFRADAPGRYDGMCAEFCGTQHANMRFVVVAEPDDAFAAWLAHQRTPAAPPSTDVERRGHDIFMKTRCVACHAIAGTEAFATVGPDLTHVASRESLAAGRYANDRDHLAGWISDPQAAKPGVAMPATPLPPDDLQALIAYLGSLR